MCERTPGEWNVGWNDRGLGHGDYGVISEESPRPDKLIAEVITGLAVDAYILAAAPKLLATCEETDRLLYLVVEWMGDHEGRGTPLRQRVKEHKAAIGATIAKAKGENHE